MSHALNIEARSQTGKRYNRRLREAGKIPGILYGHGREAVAFQAPSDAIDALIRHNTRVVDLTGDVNEKALISELQWDTFGNHILHIDLTRVSADEKVEVEVAVELRGEAPGVREGGVLEHVLHALEIECLVTEIPEKLSLSVNELKIGGSVLAKNVRLPEGARLLSDPEAVVVHVVEPAAEVEEVEGAEGAEPELIGRKEGEEESED